MMRVVSFTLNGKPTSLTVDETRPLLWVLRDDLGLTGSKFGCACVTEVGDVQGKRVLTIEGLAKDGRLHAIQQAFIDHAAYQCGYCTPGMIMGAYAMLLANPKATRADIVRQLDSHLCRCGAHVRIVEAVEAAAGATKGGAR